MTGFIPPHRQQQFLKASADFFNWWLHELVQLLPVKWRSALSGQQALCRLTLEQDQLKVVLETQGRERTLGSAVFANVPGFSPVGVSAEDESSAVQQLMANIASLNGQAPGRVVLELGDDYLLIRDISLPLVSDNDIASVLAHEIDRLAPFQKNNVCYSYEALEKNVQTGKLRLRLICLERDVLEKILEQCAALGLSVTQVQRRAAPSRAEPFSKTMNLLPIDKRPLKEKLWNGANKLAAALALALLIMALIIPLWHYEKQIGVLSEEVNALQEQSKVVRAKQTSLVTMLDIRDALVKRKNSELEKLIILHNLTRVIPDNTWLTRVTIRDSSLEIEGESDKSSDLIEKLESEEAFYQVEFASSVTRNSRTGKERFQIKMHLSDKPAALLNTSALTTDLSESQQVMEGTSTDE